MKNIGHHACLREKEHLFRYRAYFEGNRLRFVRARAHVRAQMTQIAEHLRIFFSHTYKFFSNSR